MSKNDSVINTLCIIYTDERILLGLKKRGFGKDRWNGFGGKIGKAETIESAAIREVFEESGLIVNHLDPRGLLHFDFEDDTDPIDVHLFSAYDFNGEPIETEEMKPQWFNFDAIPFDRMWPSDIYWLPEFIKGKNIEGSVHFQDNDTVQHHTISFK